MPTRSTSSPTTLIAPDTGEILTVTAVGTATKGATAITGGGTGVSYTPTLNATGADTFGYTISDGNGGTDNGTVNVTITPVNDTPVLTTGADQAVLEDAGLQSVASFASKAPGGGTDEAGQTVTYHVSSTNAALFSAVPAISAIGTLTYTPATNANGTSTVSVYVTDNGGTLNGGDDTSNTQTFDDHGHAGQRRPVVHQGRQPDRPRGRGRTDRRGLGHQQAPGWRHRRGRPGGHLPGQQHQQPAVQRPARHLRERHPHLHPGRQRQRLRHGRPCGRSTTAPASSRRRQHQPHPDLHHHRHRGQRRTRAHDRGRQDGG